MPNNKCPQCGHILSSGMTVWMWNEHTLLCSEACLLAYAKGFVPQVIVISAEDLTESSPLNEDAFEDVFDE